jgi:hypothetical protein
MVWRDITVEEQYSYGTAKEFLERMLVGFKDDFPEDMLLGNTEIAEQDVRLLVASVEKFLLAAAKENGELTRQLELLRRQSKNTDPRMSSNRLRFCNSN